MSDREATSELSSSVSKGAGYNKVYLLGHELEEDLLRSPEREPSTHSLIDEEEDDEENGKGDEKDEENDEGDEHKEGKEEDEGDQSKGGKAVD
nr:hypothetical protein CFP56_65327 [Quercus suber]